VYLEIALRDLACQFSLLEHISGADLQGWERQDRFCRVSKRFSLFESIRLLSCIKGS
jgi:hypothetical protein